jgi:hypothetical protein
MMVNLCIGYAIIASFSILGLTLLCFLCFNRAGGGENGEGEDYGSIPPTLRRMLGFGENTG